MHRLPYLLFLSDLFDEHNPQHFQEPDN